MGRIVCRDCAREIAASASSCPHCGAARARRRRFGVIDRNRIGIRVSTAAFVASIAAVAAGLAARRLNAGDEAAGIAAIAGGVVGLVLGSALGRRMAEEFSRS